MGAKGGQIGSDVTMRGGERVVSGSNTALEVRNGEPCRFIRRGAHGFGSF